MRKLALPISLLLLSFSCIHFPKDDSGGVWIDRIDVRVANLNVSQEHRSKVNPQSNYTLSWKPGEPNHNQNGKHRANDIARFLAGMPVVLKSPFAGITKTKSWRNHSYCMSRTWKRTISKKSTVVKKWAKKELKHINDAGGLLFYPFAGPDVLYPQLFFPGLSTIVMIGLESIGTIPNFKAFNGLNGEKVLSKYLKRVSATTKNILRLSFFRTQSMKKQMQGGNPYKIDGTLPTILVLLARLGNKIKSIEKVAINSNGDLVSADRLVWDKKKALFPERKFKKKRRRWKKIIIRPVYGNRIFFVDKDGKHKTLVYLSMNLSNDPFRRIEGLRRRKDIQTYLRKLTIVTTYLKAASYLLHRGSFSIIRNIILEKTRFHLQDDSGIPVKYVDKSKFRITLFGKYYNPIELFSTYSQKALKKKYRKQKNTKLLPFGIGYHCSKRKSNLQLLSRITNSDAG